MANQGWASRAVKLAGSVRRQFGAQPDEPVCPFDVAEFLGVSVRLVGLPSLEGMYLREQNAILVGAQRPMGRKRYSCAHEIGHHVFGHGSWIHRSDGSESEPVGRASVGFEEFLAERFAAALLMPKLVVMSAFARRGLQVSSAVPNEVFLVAQELGVGYTTLLDHLERTLHELDRGRADLLRRVPLPRIRSELGALAVCGDVVVVDRSWRRAFVDVEVGDVVLIEPGVIVSGPALGLDSAGRYVAVAAGPAVLKLCGGRPSVAVRVSKRQYTGLVRYSRLEDCS